MNKRGLTACEILMPNTDDLTSFAVVACDQFTSDGAYWQELKELTKGKLTTLDMILPEYYLNGDVDSMLVGINENIRNYSNTAKVLPKGMILSVRTTASGKQRLGLITAVDLEEYDFTKGNKPLIRPTEATISERIPPRLKIRKDAFVEFPHVMMFIDDENKAIIEGLFENRNSLEKIYDFDLNMGGGHLEGYFVSDYEKVEGQFIDLIAEDRLMKKYGETVPFMMAVGDGNHSLATAKAHWENIKKTLKDGEEHPARYALVEIVNIYDDGIYFEPIHRLVTGVDKDKFIEGYKALNHGTERVYNGELISFDGEMNVPDTIISLDKYVATYIAENGGEVDYVHGDDDVKRLADERKGVAILLSEIEKSDLFVSVVKKGTLPKKTFSIGEAREKRYYLEGRKIVK